MRQTVFSIKRLLISVLTFLFVIGAWAQDMLSTPLTLEATTSGDITFNLTLAYGTDPSVMNAIEYQKNGGEWTAYTWGDAIPVAVGDKVAFRGDNVKYYGNGNPSYNSHIASTADVYVYGNMMSLIHASDFATNYEMTGDWNFADLFKLPTENPWDPPVTVTTIKSHPSNDIVLPATTLTNYCYAGLFAGCKFITRAPELPATTMAVGCYVEMFRATGLVSAPALPTTVFTPYSYDDEGEHGSIDCYMQMFQDCTSLTTAPELPATTLVHGVYQNMFQGCTSLTTAPALPATDLTGGDQCYTAMFKGCTSLVTAPALPATTLAEDCYHRMFEGCTSLQKAPVLPAPTITGQVYGGMFDGCTSLNYVKCLAVNIVDTSHGEDATTDCWLANVAATGTFVKAGEADWSVKTKTGEALNGIPAGWTVLNDGEDFVASDTPLTLETIEDNTDIIVTNPMGLTIEYSTDGGTTWESKSDAIGLVELASGTIVQFRGDNAAYSTNGLSSGSTTIDCSKDVYIYGNVMSLINSTSFATLTAFSADYALGALFYGNKYLKNHDTKDLVLPATTLTRGCYRGMFSGNSGMTKAPVLPATTLMPQCYYFMFNGCSGITTAPELPATTLADSCYTTMFQACGLTKAPVLPATTLAKECYMNMFRSCQSLTMAPELPATALSEGCYKYMFHSTALTKAPVLSATTLAPSCYFGMFVNCASLTEAPELSATQLEKSCYLGMFYNSGLTKAPQLPALTLAPTCYKQMFVGCASLTDVPTLPATTLDESCYEEMFKNCTSLVNAPDLAATTLATTCCNYMFSGCTALTKAPVLPAKTLASQCYQRMFEGCTALETAPELPATELAELCYNDMFWECTGLKNAPKLPATELVDYCYTMMFLGCSSLEKAPDLPAVTLTPGCYEHMFMNCNKLNYVKCLATDLGDDSSTDGWLTNVAAVGTFVKAPEADWSTKGTTERQGTWDDPDSEETTIFVHGIPAGWTVENYEVTTADITIGKNGKTTFCGTQALDFSYSDEVKAFIATGFDKTEGTIWMTRVKDVPAGVPVMVKGTAEKTYHVPVTEGGSSYYKNMFVGNTTGEIMSIGETSEDGQYVNYYMSGGQFKSVKTSANIGANKCYLQLPATFAAEATGEGCQVKIAASGKSSFAAPYDLDFTSLNDDVKAFTATGYDAGTKTIWLTRVRKVQKGEGLLLKGTGGETYTIPSSGVQAAYENMIVGNIGDDITINGTSDDGTLTNYYLKGGTYMSVSVSANIGTNKSYLQLPTSMLAGAAGARSEEAPSSSDVLGDLDALGDLDNLGIPSTCH
ncbi:MAG: leucine-rich repeat protein, partial [Prevotella sp.]|nr:leucine-rich repeat protein [Prevotella sp.]